MFIYFILSDLAKLDKSCDLPLNNTEDYLLIKKTLSYLILDYKFVDC